MMNPESAKPSQNEPENLGRRQALQAISAGAGTLALNLLLPKVLSDHEPSGHINPPENLPIVKPGQIPKQPTVLLEKNEIPENDERLVGVTFVEQILKTGELNVAEAKKCIFDKYYKLYSPKSGGNKEGKYFWRMKRGLEDSAIWLNQIILNAKKHNIDPKILLATGIGESYLESNSQSSAKATGPFQIIPSTAQKNIPKVSDEKIIIWPNSTNPTYDERRDYLASSLGAAALLEDNQKGFKNDLHLAITGYNGWGLASAYKKDCNNNCTYNGYNQWLENTINAQVIALRAKFNTDSKDGKFQSNEKFEIEIKKLFQKYKENFIYPEKIIAIAKVLNDNVDLVNDILRENQDKTFYKEQTFTEEILNKTYAVESGEGLISIAKKISTRFKTISKDNLTLEVVKAMLKKQNPNQNWNNLHPGNVLNIQFTYNGTKSLNEISTETITDLKILQKLNPAVIDSNANLPKDILIRIPTTTYLKTIALEHVRRTIRQASL